MSSLNGPNPTEASILNQKRLVPSISLNGPVEISSSDNTSMQVFSPDDALLMGEAHRLYHVAKKTEDLEKSIQ